MNNMIKHCASFANAQYVRYAPNETKAQYDVINAMINNTVSVKLGNKWGGVDDSDKIIIFVRNIKHCKTKRIYFTPATDKDFGRIGRRH